MAETNNVLRSAYGATDPPDAQRDRFNPLICDGEEEEDACCDCCTLPANFVAEVYERRTALIHIYLSVVAILVCLIGLYAKLYEKWSLLWSLYFASYVSLGVGYGDLRVQATTLSWLSLSLIEIAAVLVVGSVLSVTISALFLTDKEEDWVTVSGANSRLRKCSLCLLAFMPLLTLSVSLSEGWPISKSVYWFIDTTTTVGCGYATPVTKFGRLLCVASLLLVSPLFVAIFSTIVLYPRALLRNACKRRTLEAYEAMRKPPIADVSREAFILTFLCKARLIEEEDLEDAHELFNRLHRAQGI